jgi:uncharacterized protein YjeT (DUF2065 family)
MIEQSLRIAGLVLLVAGFALWSYGFVYSSFWYANEDISLFEPARIWASDLTGYPMLPGMVEQIIGLVVALMGILLQVISYYGKR